MDDENKSSSSIPERNKETNTLPYTPDCLLPNQTEINAPNASRSQSESDRYAAQETLVQVSDEPVNKVSNALEAIDLEGRAAESTGSLSLSLSFSCVDFRFNVV